MASSTSNTADIQQSFMNNVLQQNQQNCQAQATDNANNNVTIIIGSTVGGNFTANAVAAQTDATCLMVSNMEDSISNILSATIQQTNTSETDWFNGFQFSDDTNTFDVNQSVTNNINQINEATCQANSTVSASNNYTYIAQSKIGGNYIGVSSKADASANCNITNSMKNTTYNQAQASGTQSNTIKGMFVAIAGIIAFFIGILIIGVVILYSSGAINHVGYSTPPPQKPVSSDDQELMAAQELGLTPDVLQNALDTSN